MFNQARDIQNTNLGRATEASRGQIASNELLDQVLFELTWPPDYLPRAIRVWPEVHCYPTLVHVGLKFSALLRSGGLVSPAEFASMIGGIFPIALCGRSSL